MKPSWKSWLIIIIAVLGIFFVLDAKGYATATSNSQAEDKIDPVLLAKFGAESQADFFIVMTEKADLSPAKDLSTKEEKGQFVFNTLRETADRTQAELRAYLDSQGIKYRSFYIANKILVYAGSQSLAYAIADRSDVAKVLPNNTIQLERPIINPDAPNSPETIESNITFVNADDVWSLGFTGQGTVLAGNDTGLQWDHPAIIDHYRGWNGSTADHNYNWWDATGTYPTVPADGFGHGTHTTGTMVGDDGAGNQIGMAPGAKTIHCKNMTDGGSGSDATFEECFEWDLAPWDLSGSNPNPSLAPDAVNNSWGYSPGGVTTFVDEIAALQAAGILVEVSAGNEGPSCQTLRSPGDYAEVLTTGSVNHAGGSLPGTLTGFSSRGPSPLNSIETPDIMAPGENIRSSVPGSGYEGGWSGTSMAGPHVTGLIGLLWSANPGLRGMIEETTQIIIDTTIPLTGQSGSNCGGDYSVGPNNDWGYGTINAYDAVQTAILYGNPGTIAGTVVDSATSNPLEGVQVSADLGSGVVFQATTDANGEYTTIAFSGTYTVSFNLFGYYPASFPGIVVTEFQTTTVNADLDPAPSAVVEGVITDDEMGWPLYASITIGNGYDGGPVWTDPVSGYYSVTLPAGVYPFEVSSFVDGYSTQTSVVTVTSVLAPDAVTATYCSNTVVTIPDDTPAGVNNSQSVGDSGTLTDVNLLLNATHTYVGDLIVTLTHNDTATSVVVLSEPNNGTGACSGNNLSDIVLDDDGEGTPGTPVQTSCTSGTNPAPAYATNGFYTPNATLTAFDGQDLSGTWTVNVSDNAFLDTGTLNNWCLSTTVEATTQTANFSLPADPVACTAPGYTFGTSGAYAEDFEASDGGYTVTGTASWAWGAPTSGPFGAHSGSNVWGTNLAGNYNDFEDTTLTSPVIDLSAFAGEAILVDWWQWAQTESGFDYITVDVSNNGGSSWTTVYGPLSGDIDLSWAEYSVLLDPSYAVSNFQVRFHFTSDVSVTYPGWYIDDISISSGACNPPASGGLVVGNVYDVNTSDPVNGAWVTNETGSLGYAMETPLDPAVDDAFYTVYSLGGSQVHTATYTLYGEDVQSVGVVDFDTVGQDFYLPSGFVVADPDNFDVTLEIGDSTTLPLSLEDIGGANVEFEIREAPGTNPWGGIHIPASDGNFPRGTAAPSYLPAPNTKDSANSVKSSHQPLTLLGGASAIGAEFFNLEFYGLTLADPGTLTTIGPLNDTQFFAGDFIDGDFATLYTLDYGFNALYAVDTATGVYTQIGPSVPNGAETWSGMAGDPTTGDMYAMSTDCNSNTLYTVDLGSGALSTIGSASGYCIIDIAIDSNGDLYGMDILSDNLLSIDKASGAVTIIGSIGFDANYAQDMDFDENTDTLYLAAFNLTSFTGELRIADVSTGNSTLVGNIGTPSTEMDAFAIMTGGGGDVLWVSESPITGTVPANGSVNVDVTFDAAQVPVPGQYTAYLNIAVDTPQLELTVPLTLNVTCSTCGTLDGEITDEATGLPLVSTIHITSTLGFDFTIEDVTAYNVQLTPGEYYVNASSTGYLSETVTVDITTGNTTTQDFALWADTSILSFSPASVEESLNIGEMVTNTVTITNSGAAPMEYEVNIGGYSGPFVLLAQTEVHIPRFTGEVEKIDRPLSAGQSPEATKAQVQGPLFTTPMGEQAYALDVYPGLNLLQFPDVDVPGTANIIGSVPQFHPAGDFLNGDFSTLYALDYDTNEFVAIDTATATRTVLATTSPNGSWSGMTGSADGTLYAVSSSCGSSSTLYTVDPDDGTLTTVGEVGAGTCIIDIAINAEGEMYGVDIVSDSLYAIDPSTGAGTVVGSLGVDANYAQGMDFEETSGVLYWAAYTSQGELRIIDTTTGASASVGLFPGGAEIDAFAFATGGSGGVGGWAYAVPNFGTVPPFSTTTFELVFDARSLYQTGDYYAELSFDGSFANDPGTMPLTMHVSCPTCGFMAGDIYDAFTSAPVNADVYVSSEAGTAITLTGVASYSLALQPGSYDFLVTADGYFSETATVSVEEGQTVVTDFAMTPIVAIMEYSPFSFERTVALGQVLSDTLTLGNAGTVAYDFELSDVQTGAPGALAAPTAGSILLVDDDDNGPDVQSYYTAILDAMGMSYDVWDTGGADTEPDEATLSAYSTVIWFTGVSFGGTAGPGSAGEAALGAWLDSGGCFLISSQDYYFDRGLTTFMSSYLGVASVTSDVGQTSVTGAGSLFAGLGPYTLSYPFSNYSDDVTPDGTAEVAFTGDSSANAAINKITSAYSTVFLGYPLEAISTLSDQIDVMNGFMSSCLSDAPWLAELPAIGTVAPDATETVGIIFDASVITQTGTYTAELRFDGTYDNSVSNATVVMHVIADGEAGVTVGDSTGSGEVGTTVTHTMWITNTGNVADVFTLGVTGNTWNTEVSATTIVLDPGESAYVMCYVDVPVDAADGDTDTATVTVTSSFDGNVSDSATATTEATVPEPATYQLYLPKVAR